MTVIKTPSCTKLLFAHAVLNSGSRKLLFSHRPQTLRIFSLQKRSPFLFPGKMRFCPSSWASSLRPSTAIMSHLAQTKSPRARFVRSHASHGRALGQAPRRRTRASRLHRRTSSITVFSPSLVRSNVKHFNRFALSEDKAIKYVQSIRI